MKKKFIIPLLSLSASAGFFFWRLSKGQSIEDSINPLSMVTKSGKRTAEDFIKESEGLSSKIKGKNSYVLFPALAPLSNPIYAYYDTGGVPTIGFGTTHYPGGSAVKITDQCTVKQAYEYFQHEFDMKFNEIKKKSARPINDNQAAGFTSLAYRAGRTAFFDSTMWRLWNEDAALQTVASQFDRWVYDKADPVYPAPTKGLVNRAASEKRIFLTA